MSTTSISALQQLEEIRKKCVGMGAIIGFPASGSPKSYFTATVPEQFCVETNALSAEIIQQKIATAARGYPDVVFYRFDSFSSLLYVM